MIRRAPLPVAIACLLAATLFWAINYVIGSSVVTRVDPVTLTLLRWCIAVVPLVVLAQLIERPDWRAVARRWPMLLAMAVLGMVGYNLTLYWALRFTTPVSASLINAINPALIALIAALLLRERLGWRRVVGMLVGLVGVLLVITRGSWQAILAREINPGDLLMILAISVWTGYTLLGRRLHGVPPIASTAAQAALTIAVMLPVAAVTGIHPPSRPEDVTAIIVIGLLPSVGSYLLWNVALRRIPASAAGVFLNFIAVFTVAISVVLGTRAGLPELLGGALVLGGVALASLSTSWRTRTPPDSGDATERSG